MAARRGHARCSGVLVALVALAFTPRAGAQIDLALLARREARSGALPRVLGEHVSTIVELPRGGARPPGFVPIGESGASELGTLDLPTSAIPELALARPELRIRWSPPLRPFMDRADGWTGASRVRGATGLTGAGVIVGIVDTGVDPAHLDLRNPDGSTRVLWLLDFSRERAGLHPELEDALGCRTDPNDETQTPCSVLASDDIEALLATEDPDDDPHDLSGHGTHVASLAAGNGRSQQPPKYVGVAPEASLVVVRVARRGGGIFDTDVLKAARFVFDRAAELAMPAVVNLSLGGDFAGHDGNSGIERGLESLVGAGHPGRAIVVAAGNSAGLYEGFASDVPQPLGVHTEVHVPEGASALVPIVTPRTESGTTTGTLYVWLTTRQGDRLAVGVENRAGAFLETIPWGSAATAERGTVEVSVVNGVSDEPSPLPAGSNGAAVVIHGSWDSSEVFGLRLEGPATAWIWVQGEGDLSLDRGIGPLLPRAQKEGTVSVPATAPGLIAVGATLNRSDWPDYTGETVLVPAHGSLDPAPLDTTAFYSGAGPNALGALKPDLVAPGVNVIGALARGADPRDGGPSIFEDFGICEASGFAPSCQVVDDQHAVSGGTSMAAPMVTGAIALLFERDPTLDQDGIRARLQAGARPLQGAVFDERQLGAGALDIERTLETFDAPDAALVPGAGTRLALAESFAHPDPAWPLQALVELRDDSGRVADGFDPRRLAVEAAGGTVQSLLRRAPGLWQFTVVTPAGSGGRMLSVRVRFDGRTLVARDLPIAVDHALSETGPSARGGCSVAPGARSEAWWPLALLAAALGLRASRFRRGTRAPNAVRTAPRRDRTRGPDRLARGARRRRSPRSLR